MLTSVCPHPTELQTARCFMRRWLGSAQVGHIFSAAMPSKPCSVSQHTMSLHPSCPSQTQPQQCLVELRMQPLAETSRAPVGGARAKPNDRTRLKNRRPVKSSIEVTLKNVTRTHRSLDRTTRGTRACSTDIASSTAPAIAADLAVVRWRHCLCASDRLVAPILANKNLITSNRVV